MLTKSNFFRKVTVLGGVATIPLLLAVACGPVGDNNPCGLPAPGCASDTEEWACDGPEVVSRPCASSEVCVEGEGCVDQICDPEVTSCANATTELRCIPPGHAVEEVACPSGVTCAPASGCTAPVCEVNQRMCLSPDDVGICNASRTDFELLLTCSDTDPTTTCFDGQCVSACERAELTNSYLGCEYWAADLPQYPANVSEKDYAIVVSNPSDSQVAHVTISTNLIAVANLEVQPQSTATYSVPPPRRNIEGAGQWSLGYLVQSDIPVAAYQFNSLTTVEAASTDASLLFATHTLATKYYVMDYVGRDFLYGDNFLAVYAINDNTSVTVTPTANIRASQGGDVPFNASAAGQPVTFELQTFDVLVLMAEEGGQNLTGSVVEGTAPIGVFGGNRCTNVPEGVSFCDHLEQQIFPRQALGTEYVVSKTAPRMYCTVEDRIRVLADADNTVITVDPEVAGPFTLNAGEWEEFAITEHTLISSDQPFYVGQFIRSSNGDECEREGDPAFILQVPTAQFRLDYVFLTPETYTTDFVAIIAKPEANVQLDGSPVTLETAVVGSSAYSVTTVTLTADGPHRVDADDKVGIIVYGYGGPDQVDPNGVMNVSYGYPGGLDLTAINPVE